MMRSAPLSVRSCLFAGLLTCSAATQAQIRTDSSWGRTPATLAGPGYVIPQAMGYLSGSNLFQSFNAFNIRPGESVNFTTATSGVANLITRVTGGSVSLINGSLSLTPFDGTPGFYFINPAGVTFGAGASINVPGAFHVSTANTIKFPDGTFYADLTATSTFSSAPPQAFGFLGSSRAAVTATNGATVITGPGQTLDIVAGDVAITNQAIVGKFGGSGELRAVATGGAAVEIPIFGAAPAVTGNLTLDGGAQILVVTGSSVDAGSITLSAGDVSLSNLGNVYSLSVAGGKGADIAINAAGALSVTNGAYIDASTSASGNAGAIDIHAGILRIDGQQLADTGIRSAALPASSGNAGAVSVTSVGDASVVFGYINSATYSTGNGGPVSVSAKNLTLDGQGNSNAVGISTANFPASSGSTGTLTVNVAQDLKVLNGAAIDASTFSAADAGAIQVKAGNILLDGQATGLASISAAVASQNGGHGGTVNISTPGSLVLRNGGEVEAATFGTGDAGTINVSAGSINITGQGSNATLTGIIGFTVTGATGNAGNINVTAGGGIALSNDGIIDSSTFSTGQAGSITVHAGSLSIDGSGRTLSAISSNAYADPGGNAGNINVDVSGPLSVVSGGRIDSSTYGAGHAGTLAVNAGSITIDGMHTPDLITGIFSSAWGGSKGDAGSIQVTTPGSLIITDRGEIDSTTYSIGNAGQISVKAASITIDDLGQTGIYTGIFSETLGDGHAGSLDVVASDTIKIVNGGSIDTLAYASGVAGTVGISANKLIVDGQGFGYANISSATLTGSTGNAGSVQVQATDSVSMANGGRINSATFGDGNAGTVRVNTANLALTGARTSINASAQAGSSGQTGNVIVEATQGVALADQANLSIRNSATVADPTRLEPTTLTVSAPVISLEGGAFISAASSGNVAASNLVIQAGQHLVLNQSSISTSANDGNGGAITVQGGTYIVLDQSQVTTSVSGLVGNGGDIRISADALVMVNGFVQANTAAANAQGGNVQIQTRALVPSFGSLLVGGQTPFLFTPGALGFNVIQAAAPTGVSGTVSVSSPELDVAGGLHRLSTQLLDPGRLARSLCAPVGVSSLTQAGYGGFAPSARDAIGPDWAEARADRTTDIDQRWLGTPMFSLNCSGR